MTDPITNPTRSPVPGVAREAASGPPLMRLFFPFYCALAAFVTFGFALYDGFQIDGDAIAYMDIGDLLRAHNWAGIVNGYWHPMYPAFLSLGHFLSRATLATELRAYYLVNFAIFLLEMLAVVAFTDSIVRLRTALHYSSFVHRSPRDTGADATQTSDNEPRTTFLLTRYPLRYLGLALLVIASQRELSLGKVRPDALLQAFLLFALAALLTHLATNRLRYAALMGLALGCAYLTKSFAFVLAFLCILALVVYRWIWLKHSPARILTAALIAFTCFAVVAGPYVAALSHQKGRLDFGDSGSLNYAWYVGGTEKMHLQPYQTSQFGSAEVHLKHPERELLHSPLILSYAALPYGTYPDWFDTTYFNDQIKPHFTLRGELPRAARNCVLVVRYLFNHPEALILFALFIALGARLTFPWRPAEATTKCEPANPFWLVPLLLGVSIWGIYAVVNTEERYVTVAYLTIILTLFAMLRTPAPKAVISTAAQRSGETPAFSPDQAGRNNSEQIVSAAHLEPQISNLASPTSNLPSTASALIFLLALLATGESLRTVLEDRRQLSIVGSPGGWYSPTQDHVAASLRSLGIQPGDTIACVGFIACLEDPYYARLDRVRILTEIYSGDTPAYPFLATLPNRDQAIATVRAQGARVLVADFGHVHVSASDPAFRNWRQLGDTTFYALPLNP